MFPEVTVLARKTMFSMKYNSLTPKTTARNGMHSCGTDTGPPEKPNGKFCK